MTTQSQLAAESSSAFTGSNDNAQEIGSTTVARLPAAEPAVGEHGAAEPRPPRKPGGKRKLILLSSAALLLSASAYYGYDWLTVGRFMVATDDAYVAADSASVTAKIPGYVNRVAVSDNSRVKAGDPLIFLDDSDYRNALDQAEAQIATQQATVERIGRQILSARAEVTQAAAQLASAQAIAANAGAQFKRTSTLVEKAVASPKELDAVRAAMLQANAAVTAAEAGVEAATAKTSVVEAQEAEARRVLAQHQLQRDQAELNLEHTVIRAPFDGVIGNRAAQPGEYVQPGQRLLAVVPLQAIYVDANFKETQVERIVPGQKVTITVDAYPGMPIEGSVESVSPASGSVFSLLPPDNATGNFTKIIQRVPVRIALPSGLASEGLVRPGMSVVAEIDTRAEATELASR